MEELKGSHAGCLWCGRYGDQECSAVHTDRTNTRNHNEQVRNRYQIFLEIFPERLTEILVETKCRPLCDPTHEQMWTSGSCMCLRCWTTEQKVVCSDAHLLVCIKIRCMSNTLDKIVCQVIN